MITINATKERGILRIGKCWESDATCILFDIRKWIADFGDGTAVLLHKRPDDEEEYPTLIRLEDGFVRWQVSSADTAQAGIGMCELQYITENSIVKSKIWKTLTLKSLEDAGDMGNPERGWVADMLAKIQSMIDNVDCGCNVTVASDEETDEMLEEIYG